MVILREIYAAEALIDLLAARFAQEGADDEI